MMRLKKRARRVAPDISEYRGLNGLGAIKMRAREYAETLQHGGFIPEAPFYGEKKAGFDTTLIIEGYRASDDSDRIRESLQGWASGNLSAGHPVMFSLVQQNGRLACFYSASSTALLARALPDAICHLGETSFGHLDYGAVVLGAPSMRLDYDTLVEAAGSCSFRVSALCLPSPCTADKLDQLAAIRGMFESNRIAIVPGNGGKARIEVPEIASLLALCDALRDDLLSRPDRTQLVFLCAAESEELLETVITLVKGSCRSIEGNAFKRAVSRHWNGGDGSYPIAQGGRPAAYDVAVDDAVLALMPPRESHAGFSVSLSSLASDRRAFSGIGVRADGACYEIGVCSNDESLVRVPMNEAHSAFVCGNPGTGKTNLLFRMARTANGEGVATLLIDASSKKESAARLLACTKNMEVLGVGPSRANIQLRFNPLAIPPGTQVAKHALDFAAALLRAADDEPEAPLPQAIEGAVKKAYAAAGWGLDEVAYEDPSRPWPTIADVDVEGYVGRSAYEPKVKGNLAQAMRTRLDRLMTYENMFCGTRKFSLERVIGGNVVLELGDMGERMCAFTVACLLGTLVEYAVQLPTLPHGGKPRLVVIIDELKALLECDDGSGSIARLIGRAYREFRSKGVVLVTATQRVEGAEDAMASAAVKVAFRCDWREDAETIASAFGLEPYQRRLVGTLPDMHAVAKLPGESQDAIPIVTGLFDGEHATGQHAACACCKARVLCGRCKRAAAAAARRVPDATADTFAKAVSRPGFDPVAIEAAREGLSRAAGPMAAEEEHCLAGMVLGMRDVDFETARKAFMARKARR